MYQLLKNDFGDQHFLERARLISEDTEQKKIAEKG